MKPGETRNPNGRPKKNWTWAELYEDAVEELDESGEPIKKTISRTLARLAKKGDVSAIKELTNRTDGMPLAETKLSGELKTSAALPMTPEIAKLAEEYEAKILEQLKKSNSKP